jgi:hypothetical protein
MAELAVRLGSPIVYDRRGNVMWYTGFEYGDSVVDKLPVGGGSSITPNGEYVETGAFSLALVAGSLVDNLARVIRYLPFFARARVSAATAALNFGQRQALELHALWWDGSYVYTAGARMNNVDLSISYYNAVGGWTPFASMPYPLYNYPCFVHLKLTVDTIVHKAVSLGWDDLVYDLSDYPIYTAAAGLPPHFGIWVTQRTVQAGLAGTAFIDNIIYTIDD